MATKINEITAWPIKRVKYNISVSEVTALGASTTGTVTLGFNLPPKSRVLSVGAFNAGVAAATLTTLTVQVGDAGDPNRYLDAQTVYAANAGAHSMARDLANASNTANTAVTVLFTGDANLSTTTGLTDGVDIIINYIEA